MKLLDYLMYGLFTTVERGWTGLFELALAVFLIGVLATLPSSLLVYFFAVDNPRYARGLRIGGAASLTMLLLPWLMISWGRPGAPMRVELNAGQPPPEVLTVLYRRGYGGDEDSDPRYYGILRKVDRRGRIHGQRVVGRWLGLTNNQRWQRAGDAIWRMVDRHHVELIDLNTLGARDVSPELTAAIGGAFLAERFYDDLLVVRRQDDQRFVVNTALEVVERIDERVRPEAFFATPERLGCTLHALDFGSASPKDVPFKSKLIKPRFLAFNASRDGCHQGSWRERLMLIVHDDVAFGDVRLQLSLVERGDDAPLWTIPLEDLLGECRLLGMRLQGERLEIWGASKRQVRMRGVEVRTGHADRLWSW